MARRWYNEDFRKLYTRQDGPWLNLPWCARGLAADLLRWANEDGVVALLVEEGDTPAAAIATVVRCRPNEVDVIERAVAALLTEGYLVVSGKKVRIKNFVDAQERLSQEAIRQRRARDKKPRETVTEPEKKARKKADGTVTDSVTSPVTDSVTSPVTDSVTSPVTDSVTVTPNVTPNVTGDVTQMFAVSRRDETRRDEEKPSSRASGADLPMDVDRRQFRRAWEQQFQQPVDATAADTLFALLADTAEIREVTVAGLISPFLAAVDAEFADQRERSVHRGAVTPLHVVDARNAGAQFARCLARLDGKRMGPGSSTSPSRQSSDEPEEREGDRPPPPEKLRQQLAEARARAVPPPDEIRALLARSK